jgi:hypothetical protein
LFFEENRLKKEQMLALFTFLTAFHQTHYALLSKE